MTIKVTVTFSRVTVDDFDGDVSWLTQDYADVTDPVERAMYKAQDAEQLAAYHRGDWGFIGIRAKATIWVQRHGSRTNYEIESSGVYGIESSSNEDYLNAVFKEECSQLRDDIEAMKGAQFIEVQS